MAKKEQTKEKAPKTIKVVTLVKVAVAVVALVVAYTAGVYTNNEYKKSVANEAAALVTQLKSSR